MSSTGSITENFWSDFSVESVFGHDFYNDRNNPDTSRDSSWWIEDQRRKRPTYFTSSTKRWCRSYSHRRQGFPWIRSQKPHNSQPFTFPSQFLIFWNTERFLCMKSHIMGTRAVLEYRLGDIFSVELLWASRSFPWAWASLSPPALNSSPWMLPSYVYIVCITTITYKTDN